MGKNITIIGAGSMGTAMAVLLSKNGNNVNIWTPFKEEADMLNNEKEHLQRLPGVKIPNDVTCYSDIELAMKDAEMTVLAVPSQTTRSNSKLISQFVEKDGIVVTCSKGIEENTCKLLTEVMEEEIPHAKVAALSGPSHAEEIAREIPTAVVAAASDENVAHIVQDSFMGKSFRVYSNTDVKGVELGGALKNVIALCAGISDGLGFGDNTKAALMTRGMTEISRLGVAMGANPHTFGGLTGIGDLIVTCTSMHSRNRRAGILIGKGKSVEDALAEVKMVVEGVATAKPAYQLSQRYDISMPIIFEAYEILYNNKNPRQAVIDLLSRDRKGEMEDFF